MHWDRILEDFGAACHILGVESVVLEPLLEERSVDLEVRELHDILLPHVQWAETILTHWPGDVHQVHRGIARAVEIGTRPFRRRRNVYTFEVPTSTDQAFGLAFVPQSYVALSESQVQRKLDAISCYSTEAAPGRNVNDLERRLRLRGSEVGLEFAECFAVARQFLE
jgi:LmbE family N-acetylglucosaminyl deacetylase